jgi:signal transduction histidine kinase
MDAGMSHGSGNQEKIEEIFQSARTQARDGLQETRRALRTLRSTGYSGPKGLDAIYRVKQVFQNVTGIEVIVDAGNIPPHFTDDIDRMIYRTVQEALTNSMRHGRSTRVRISFWLQDTVLILTVTDNGIGSTQIVKGIGLAGMEERLAPYGGTLATSNPAEGGFRISIRLPIPQAVTGETQNGNSAKNQGSAG